MSNFTCEKCGTVLIDGPNGYITGCEHYPIENEKSNLFKQDLFSFFVSEHKLHLLDGEMNDIIHFIHKNYPDEELKEENARFRKALETIFEGPQFKCKDKGFCESHCRNRTDFICEYLIAKDALGV